jgi:hypothetical protein
MPDPVQNPPAPSPGTPGGNQPGNQDSEAIKGLQRTISQKDLELQNALKQIEELKSKSSGSQDSEAFATMTAQIKALTDVVGSMTNAQAKEALRVKYPDIVPDLLLGKTDAEIESLVQNQRALVQAQIDRAPISHQPVFKSKDDIQAEIDRIKKDPSISTDTKLLRVRELEDLKHSEEV